MEKLVWAEVNLEVIAKNMQAIRSLVPGATQIMAVVKANAYGHGVIPVTKACLENGADSLAVAIAAEGVQLRKSGYAAPILVMGYTPPEQYQAVLEHGLMQAIFSLEQGRLLSQAAVSQGVRAKIHLKLDTGMGRIGFLDSQLEQIRALSQLPNLIIEGVFTHFAAADEADPSYTLAQLSLFAKLLGELKGLGIEPRFNHAANSAGIIRYPDAHFNLVRPGLMIYGMYPSTHVSREKVKLIPAMSLKTRVAFIKKVPKGTSISYGCTYRTPEEQVIATLPVGYADGYPRLLSNCGQVMIDGRLAPVVGRVCMDQTMINVTHLDTVKVGDEVVLFGHNRSGGLLPVEEVAEKVGTISYEMVCKVSYRVPRIYVNGKNKKVE
jgi:alanine racemase